MNGKVAKYGMLVALAFILSWVEALIPFGNLGIPGIKIGLANLVVFAAIYLCGPWGALLISLVRIVLSGLAFNGMFYMIYSLAGGMLSLGVMLLCRKSRYFSKIGVSVAGGISHNIGQICVAALTLGTSSVFYYFPVLLIAGTGSGAVIGCVGGIVMEKLPRGITGS